MRNCLLVSAYFPPMGGVGVQRITKFVKYLPNFGWRPIVVTVPTWATKVRKDPSMLDEIPRGIEIHRPFYFDYRKVIPGDVAKLFRPLERRYLYPDKYNIWNRFVLKRVKNIVCNNEIEVIFINCPPFSGFHLAYRIKKDFGLPVVLNLRDAFSLNQYNKLNQRHNDIRRAREIEDEVISIVDRMVFVTPHMAEEYKQVFPEYQEKFSVIPNGYDEFDFVTIDTNSSSRNPVFSIGYNGSYSKIAPMRPLASALLSIHEKHKIKMVLNIATQNSFRELRSKFRTLFRYGLVDFKGFLPHKESLKNLAASHILALTFANDPSTDAVYSGKAIEYLRMNRPVLLMHRKGSDISKLIEETRSGVTVNIDDPDEIVDAILSYFERWKNGQLRHTPRWERIRVFDYRHLTKKLASIFEEIIRV